MRQEDEGLLEIAIAGGQVTCSVDGHVVLQRPLTDLFCYLKNVQCVAQEAAHVAHLRAELSWALACRAENEEYQTWLDCKRREDPLFINPLGASQRPELFP